MKSKQKALALLAAGCICLLAAGCGKASGTEQGSPDVQETSAEQGGERVPETAPASDGQTSEEKSALTAPQIAIGRENLEEYETDTNRWLVHTEYDTLSVSGEGYETLAEGVRRWSETRAEEIGALSEEYAGYASEDEAYSDAESTAYQYSIYQSLELARADSRVVSIVEMNSEYTGGAHGNYGYYGYTFDTESGEVLELADILEDTEGFQEAADAYVVQKLEETQGDGLFPEYADTVRNMWTRNEGPNWYLGASGITFIFNPYEVGPYAMGDVQIALPYEEFASYIKDEYGTLSGPGVAAVPEDEPVFLSLGGDESQASSLRIYQEKEEEYGDGPVYVELNDSSVQVDEYTYGWIVRSYVLTREDGRTFVLVSRDAASDDFTMYVYEITGGTIRECDSVYGISFRNGVANTESLTLQAHLDVLGTYTAMMDYVIGENGKLEQQDEFFRIDSDGSAWKTLINIKELPVTVDGAETTLPAGSHISITATDNAGTALFYNEDTGENGEIHYTKGDGTEDDWTIYIDGIPDYEYFEMVPYAG